MTNRLLHHPIAVIALVASFLMSISPLAPHAKAATTGNTSSWPQIGYDAAHTGYNPAEHTLSTKNVGGLSVIGKLNTGDIVQDPPSVSGGWVYAGSDSGRVYGWNTTTGTSWHFPTYSDAVDSPAVI